MGSKNRIAKYILPIMLKEMEEKGYTTWVELLLVVVIWWYNLSKGVWTDEFVNETLRKWITNGKFC